MATVALSSTQPGRIIKLKENGVAKEFIVLIHGYPAAGRTLLLRNLIYDRTLKFSDGTWFIDSEMHGHLNSTYYNSFESHIRSLITPVTIKTKTPPQNPGGSDFYFTSMRFFILSCREVGFGFYEEGQHIPYFNSDQRRAGLYENQYGVIGSERYILRTPDSLYQCSNFVDRNGKHYEWRDPYGGRSKSGRCRPAFTLPSDVFVDDGGNIILNTAPTIPGSINVPTTVNGGSSITISWPASTDAEKNLSGYKLERNRDSGGWNQFYQGTATSTTDAIIHGWKTVQYRVRAYDALNAHSGYRTSEVRNVFNNTAPTVPGSISVPTTVNGGSSITISWAASTDAQNNLSGYKLERNRDGTGWSQIYQASATSTTDAITHGWKTVQYRVRAYDAMGAHSDFRTSEVRNVFNNTAPTVPSSITVPGTVVGGGKLTISWGASTDAQNNLTGYKLERRVDGGAYQQIHQANTLSFTDTITKGWKTVQYQVRAYDAMNAHSGYRTSDARTVDNNTPPVISCSSNGNIGSKAAGFSIPYTVTDAEGDAVSVTESMDGAVKRTYNVTLGASNNFDVTGEYFMTLLNGAHTMTVVAKDAGGKSATHTITFTKAVHTATITLKTPKTTSAAITKMVLNIARTIPDDANFKVEATNNANDASPAWEDITASVLNRLNHLFTNKTAANGHAFNFRITASRGSSGTGGHISSVGGAFE